MFWKKLFKPKTKAENFLEKFEALNVGRGYLYVLVDDNFNFRSYGGKNILFFVNKLEALIYQMCCIDKSSTYKVKKYDELGSLRDLINAQLKEGKVEPVMIMGYLSSDINGNRQFLVAADKQPLLYAMAVKAEEVIDHFDLRLYLLPHMNSGVDLMLVVEKLIFSNAAPEEKVKEVAQNMLVYIKNTGVIYSKQGDPIFDKDVTVRNLFVEN